MPTVLCTGSMVTTIIVWLRSALPFLSLSLPRSRMLIRSLPLRVGSVLGSYL